MIETAIGRQTQWTVFEANDANLWREVDRVIRTFLDDLWRAGKLDGATAAEAYNIPGPSGPPTPSPRRTSAG